MNNYQFKQTLVVVKHETMIQLKSFTYWITIILPIFILMGLIKLNKNKLNVYKNSNNKIDFIIGTFIPIFIFIICILYTTIIANSVARDKTTKISELLMSMVSAKSQLFGKIISSYILVLLNILIYLINILIFQHLFKFKLISIIIKKININFFIYSILDILIALLIVLSMTSEIASFITDNSQVSVAVIPVNILIITGMIESSLFNIPGNIGVNIFKIFLDIIFMIPPIGVLTTPTLIINGGLSYFEGYIILIIQLIITLLLLKPTIKHYKHGLLSTKHINPFLLDLYESLK